MACARHQSDEAAAEDGAPTIERLEPSEGRAGVAYPIQVTIYGSGFMPDSNAVAFGPVSVNRPSSSGGTEITFSVPKQRQIGREAAPMVMQPGEYEVTVTTSRGRSNAVTFTLTRG